MTDVFGMDTQTGENFVESEQGVIITGSGKLTLIQQWSVQYQLQVNPVYECGTSTVYFAAKHGAGTLTCDRIVASDAKDIESALGTLCAPEAPVITAYTGQCNGSTPVRVQIEGCILTGVNFSGQAGQAYVAEQLTAQFTGMSI